MKKHSFLLVTLLTFVTTIAVGEKVSERNQLPEVGKPLPDFTLDFVKYYKKNKVTPKDFRGQWLIMDFWWMTCSSCIQSFPKVSLLQSTFQGRIQFLMVGSNDRRYNAGIENVYEKLKEKQGLKMAVAFDSVLAGQWNIQSAPHVIIIDPNGMVKAITVGTTESELQDLLDGKPVLFRPKTGSVETFNADNYNGADGTTESAEEPKGKLIYRSLLTESWPGNSSRMPVSIRQSLNVISTKGFTVQNAPLFEILYPYAYLGYYNLDLSRTDSLFYKVYPYPVIETRDSVMKRKTYNYNLVVPPAKASVESVMRLMQQDLKNNFGHIVTIETRKLAIWKLVAEPGVIVKLKTKGGTPGDTSVDGSSSNSIAAGFKLKNASIADLLECVKFYIYKGQPPFFDETGITENIDITMDCDMTSISAIQQELKKNGLNLIKGEKEFKVLVVRDPQ